MKYLISLCFVLLSAFCGAGGGPSPMHIEVEHLLNRLETSDCKFRRNGSWHAGSDASAHIRKKYEYLLEKKQLKTTESFIVKAASESSSSGKPYEVQCEGKPVMLSYIWFSNELNIYRNLKRH